MIVPHNAGGVHDRVPDVGYSMVQLALYSRLTDTVAQAQSDTWATLAELLSSHEERAERDGPLWSPVTFQGRHLKGAA